MTGTIGRIHSMESFGTVDGPGIRFVLFLSGCPLKCLYCHNPDTWASNHAQELTPQQVMDKIISLQPFLTGGVTISGGEPLLQPAFCEELITLCSEKGIHTAIDTSGAVELNFVKPALNKANLILLDIKEFDSSDAKFLTGQTSEKTFTMLKYLEKIKKPVWIRHVLLPGFTLDGNKLAQLAHYLTQFSCIEKIELLPFHKMGEFKWKQLGLNYELENTQAPSQLAVEQAKQIFINRGFQVH